MSRHCGACGRIHNSRMSHAVGRFNPEGPTGYRGDYTGAPTRTTRAEADRDVCKQWVANDEQS